MTFYSTNDRSRTASFAEAVDRGIAQDGGLYMPCANPQYDASFLKDSGRRSFAELALEISRLLIGDELPAIILRNIVEDAFDFPVPVCPLGPRMAVLELFHGPTLAFKDFGARFMARILAYLHRSDTRRITVLVATSGDTGGAVASGFSGVEGIRVVLLYPAGRVSRIQELQLTTAGENVSALEVEGNFDDCQRLVKMAFADKELVTRTTVTSANSINIARLIPQMFYYVSAWGEVHEQHQDVVFVVPSGNFGNLTAGLMAGAMGLPVAKFVAATNVNDVVPDYLRTGQFRPRSSVHTLSNAMDVGNPSNLARIRALFHDDVEALRRVIHPESCTDDDTRQSMAEAFAKHAYIFDPHGAVGYRAGERYLTLHGNDLCAVVLATAHPAKFPEALTDEMLRAVTIPDTLKDLEHFPGRSTQVGKEYEGVKPFLMSE